MARPNPNIVGQIDRNSVVTPLLQIRKEGEQTRRQNTIDASNLKTAEINQHGGELQNAAAEQKVQAGIMQSIGMDTLAVRKLLDGSEVAPELKREAGMLMGNIITRMEQIGAPTEQAQRLAMLAASDPKAAVKFMDDNTIPVLKAKMPQLFQSKILKDSDITEQGQVIREGYDGQVMAEDVPDFRGTPQESFTTEMRGEVPVQVSSTSGREFTSPRVDQGPSTVVNVAAQENAANSAYGASIGERASSRVEGAQEALNQNSDLDRILMAMERGAQTGTGEETILNMKNIGQTFFGMDFESVPEQEVVRKVQNEMALRLRNPDSGLGLTGSTSNRDLQFLKDSVPGLARSEGGNRLIIDFMKRKNQMRIDLADEQSRLIEENGGQVPSNLDSKLTKFANEYSLFTTTERKALERISSGRVSEGLTPEEQAELDTLELELAQ